MNLFPESTDCNFRNLIPVTVPDPGVDNETVRCQSVRDPFQGELTAWYVETGEKIVQGRLLFQVSWPGLALDVSANCSGVLIKKKIGIRAVVRPGDTAGYITPVQTDSVPTNAVR